jgi:hypothetical protein
VSTIYSTTRAVRLPGFEPGCPPGRRLLRPVRMPKFRHSRVGERSHDHSRVVPPGGFEPPRSLTEPQVLSLVSLPNSSTVARHGRVRDPALSLRAVRRRRVELRARCISDSTGLPARRDAFYRVTAEIVRAPGIEPGPQAHETRRPAWAPLGSCGRRCALAEVGRVELRTVRYARVATGSGDRPQCGFHGQSGGRRRSRTSDTYVPTVFETGRAPDPFTFQRV